MPTSSASNCRKCFVGKQRKELCRPFGTDTQGNASPTFWLGGFGTSYGPLSRVWCNLDALLNAGEVGDGPDQGHSGGADSVPPAPRPRTPASSSVETGLDERAGNTQSEAL